MNQTKSKKKLKKPKTQKIHALHLGIEIPSA